MTKLRKLNLSGFIANEVQVKKFEWKVYYRPVFFSTAMSSRCLRNIFSSDNTKKYDRQVGFLATVEQFHFYLVANRFPVKLTRNLVSWAAGADLGGRVQGVRTPPHPWDDLQFSNTSGVLRKKKTMWFIGVEVEQETSAPPPKKNPGSAPGQGLLSSFIKGSESVELTSTESILNVWPVTAYIRMRVDPWDVLNHTN